MLPADLSKTCCAEWETALTLTKEPRYDRNLHGLLKPVCSNTVGYYCTKTGIGKRMHKPVYVLLVPHGNYLFVVVQMTYFEDKNKQYPIITMLCRRFT